MSAAAPAEERVSGVVPRTEIERAGGLVWREGASGPELLLVYRAGHEDWTFPKGKREPNETLAETALREVAEETGVTAVLCGDAGEYRYPAGTVAMFHMYPTDAATTALAGDVTHAEWFPLDVALSLLSHPETREFLAKKTPPPLRARLEPIHRAEVALGSPERARLAVEAEILRGKLARTATSPNALVDRAAREARDGDLDTGWKLLHEARRRTFDKLDAASLEAEAMALENEAAAKLHEWRRETVVTLTRVARDAQKTDETRRAALTIATRIRDEHGDNLYFRNRLLRKQMLWIALISAALMIGFLFHHDSRHPGAAMMLGALGACASAMFTFASGLTRAKIPEHLANVLVTFVRPLIGAVSGLVAYLLLKSSVFKADTDLPFLAFAFGFSERLVFAAVETASGKPG